MSTSAVSSLLSANGGLGYLSIHALQFGAQPLLAQSCVAKGTPTSSLVLGAEVAKSLACLAILHGEGNLRSVFRGWTLRGALIASGVPSVTYLVQNYCIQVGYQNVDGVVCNILNQSKMLFTAFFSYLIMGRRQSAKQCVALTMVTLAGILISFSGNTAVSGTNNGQSNWALGVSCIIVGSALSGLGSGITEWILQGQRRNSYLFSLEMAVFGSMTILVSLLFGTSPDAAAWRQEGLFTRWSLWTLLPVLTQGWGGIVVGLITKVAGGVKKGFAVICGLLFTCLWKCLYHGESLSLAVCLAVPLVGGSIYLHAKYPPPKRDAK